MVLSEAEAEAQLAGLRRQREMLDRAIADLSLYLELGRRLTTEPVLSGEDAPGPAPSAPASQPGPRPSPDPSERVEARDRDAFRRMQQVDRGQPPASDHRGSEAVFSGGDSRLAATLPMQSETGLGRNGAADPSAINGVLSESVLARRYGRALIEAALAALEEAGRPLHAGEILAVLTSRGFSLPGHDPVAALNTRLWKRSGPGGPLKRMGDAVYALAEPEDEIRSDPVSR